MRKNNKSGKYRGNGLKPPQISSKLTVNHTYRFQVAESTSNTWYPVTDYDLLGIAGAVGTATNSSLACIAEACKIHSVEIWSPSQSTGAAHAGVRWLSLASQEVKETIDISLNTARPAHVFSKAPTDGVYGASFWLTPGTERPIFSLYLSGGEIVDINITHKLYDSGTAGLSRSVSTAVVGVMYYLHLIFSDAAVLEPIGLNSTT